MKLKDNLYGEVVVIESTGKIVLGEKIMFCPRILVHFGWENFAYFDSFGRSQVADQGRKVTQVNHTSAVHVASFAYTAGAGEVLPEPLIDFVIGR